MSTSDKSIKDFEKSLLNLEQIVQKMESGELGLEDSLKQFEKGIQLAKNCQNALSSAELKVNQLIEQNGLQKTLPFDEQNG
ncbi:MAG: exodeoxyribonuclease VII small subunit [Gammaproteobacteria bacterium]|nr:MAG: exodeoxyribonuclease VII small subunit [Gammaproteobacteria bacterium]